MAVTAETAARAVAAWSLDGGRVAVYPCGCRFWYPRTGAQDGWRVFTCVGHRPEWMVAGSHLRDD